VDPEAGLGPLTVNGQALTFDTRPVTPPELASFYASAGWHVLPPESFRRALSGTYFSLSARAPGGRLVGYGRVVSDGGIHAWIHDLIVLPEFQGRGLGSRLLTGLIERIRNSGIPYIGLFAAKGRTGFYQKFGFAPRPDNGPGMFLYFQPD